MIASPRPASSPPTAAGREGQREQGREHQVAANIDFSQLLETTDRHATAHRATAFAATPIFGLEAPPQQIQDEPPLGLSGARLAAPPVEQTDIGSLANLRSIPSDDAPLPLARMRGQPGEHGAPLGALVGLVHTKSNSTASAPPLQLALPEDVPTHATNVLRSEVRAASRATSTPSSAVGVAVHAIEAGLCIIARIPGLDRDKQSDLVRDAKALLARHGVALADFHFINDRRQ